MTYPDEDLLGKQVIHDTGRRAIVVAVKQTGGMILWFMGDDAVGHNGDFCQENGVIKNIRPNIKICKLLPPYGRLRRQCWHANRQHVRVVGK